MSYEDEVRPPVCPAPRGSWDADSPEESFKVLLGTPCFAQRAVSADRSNETHDVHNRSAVRYSVSGGNEDGLFSIDPEKGHLILAATLDYEIRQKHTLEVSAAAGAESARVGVSLTVEDANDNPPTFPSPPPRVTVIEEDDRTDLILGVSLMVVVINNESFGEVKVEADDRDASDREGGLSYSLAGDGVDGLPPEDAFFAVKPSSGELIQLRALDRDPPSGRRIWKIKVRVRDGQPPWGRPHASPLGSVRRRYPRQRSQEDPQDTEATGREDTQQDTGRKNSQVLLRKSSHTKRNGVVFQGKRREVRRKNERLDAGVHIEGRQNDAAEGPAVEGKTAISRKGFVERGTSGLGDADDDGPSDSVMSRTITKEDNYSQHSTNNRDEATVREVSVPSGPAGSAKTAANAARGTTATEDPPKTLPDGAVSEDPPGARKTRNAFEILEKHTDTEAEPCTSLDTLNGRGRGGHGREGGRRGRVHEAETTVTVIVKDINDNFPVFPNATMYAEVQENGPVDLLVAALAALDADDETEGSNARLTYAIEKNAVEEGSGEVLFR
ncbi:uncharacterized protein LOC119590526, partial [Penaeus monodon]|uniref:uncharacterized protein LOC119590526 n=1 Tax=Penaeus monodon TaxID=6687 RepID=UPI0018A76709